MKRILVLRHGKAVSVGVDHDFNRVLKNRGIDDANRMGHFINKLDFKLDRIITSGAVRAKQTADIVYHHLDKKVPITYDDRIYHKGITGVMDILKQLESDCDNVLIIGHNPTLEQVIAKWVSNDQLDLKLVTCGLALVTIKAEMWSDIQNNHGILEWMIKPKIL